MVSQSTPNKILVMRYRFIGDTLLTVPFLRNLRQQYPDAVIDVLVGPQSGELLTHCPYINNLIFFDTTRKHRYENTDTPARSFWSYVSQLREQKYDIAFVLKRSFSSALLAFLSGIPQRIGFNTEGRGFLLTHSVPYAKEIHEAEAFLNVLREINIPVGDHYLEAWWSPEDSQKADILMAPFKNNQNIMIHATSSNPAKEWPVSHWEAITAWLCQQENIVLHCLGSQSDSQYYEQLREKLPNTLQGKIQIHCGQTSLLESMALINKMDWVIGVDSGTLHMAAAVNKPVIALFGPMNEKKWGPLSDNAEVITEPVACRPCNLKVPCGYHFQCMTTLSVEKVKSACETRMNSWNGPSLNSASSS